MQIPAEFVAVLTGLVAFVVTQGLKGLSAFLARYTWLAWIDISGWGSVITAFLVTGLLFYIRLGLGYVPVQYQGFLPTIWLFIVAALTAFGTHLTVSYLAPPKKES